MVIGIADKGIVGRKHEDASLRTGGHKVTHVIIKDLRPSLAFILGAYETAIASHGKKIAIGICTQKVGVAVQGFPYILRCASKREGCQNR